LFALYRPIAFSNNEILPLCAIKGGTDGYIYVPNLSVNRLKIQLWCNDANPARMEGDQTGGVSPYPNIPEFPDGKVNIRDTGLISSLFGKSEGDPDWNYMADCVPDRTINILDVAKASNNYGQIGGSYTTDLTGIKVVFNTGEEVYPNADGFLNIPPGATSFIVKRYDTPVMALVYFFKEELAVEVKKKPIMDGFVLVE